jgi:hypothetical protein
MRWDLASAGSTFSSAGIVSWIIWLGAVPRREGGHGVGRIPNEYSGLRWCSVNFCV